MSLYARAYNSSIVGPYRARASNFATGAAHFHRGATRFYTRGIKVGGVKSGLINFLIDCAHIALVFGGLYLLITSLFA